MFIHAKKRMIPLASLFTLILTGSLGLYFYSLVGNDGHDAFIQLAPVLVFFVVLIVVLLAYFIVTFFDYLKPLRDKTAGLTINDFGIDDNLSIFSLGYIPWNNIQGAKITKAYSLNLIIIYLVNDRDILLSQPYWKRYFLQQWKKKWGSPVVISEKRISYDIISLTKSINTKAGSFKS